MTKLRNRTGAVLAGIAALAVAAIAVVAVVPAAAGPNLAPISPHDLLVKVQQAHVDALSGSVQLQSDLGIPNLAAGEGRDQLLDALAAGTTTAQVWYAGPDHVRVAVISDLAESDVIRNGADVWTWDSRTRTATHTTHTAQAAGAEPRHPDGAPPDPASLAQQFLDKVGPSTTVSVRAPSYVAGRAAYQLVLAPKSKDSTVGEVGIAVDAETGLPLGVEVTPSGSSHAALDLRFTKIDFSTPAAGLFAFTPPSDAKVENRQAPTPGDRHAGAPAATTPTPDPNRPSTVGNDWDTVAVVPHPNLPTSGQAAGVLNAAEHVSGTWGSGRLVSTALVNVLILADGDVLAGAVTPAALEAAAAHG